MEPRIVAVVQSTWQLVEPLTPETGQLFYRNLFASAPQLRSLFKGDMEAQGQRLMKMIGVAVGQLGDLDALIPALRALGARHRQYGVEDSHYEIVATALLQTLEQGLGRAFTPEVREAWATVYRTITLMMTGTREPTASSNAQDGAILSAVD